MDITPGHISQQLARSTEGVVKHLLPGGKRKGDEWCVGSPHGEDGDSCKVHLTGERAGLWCDFANPDQSGDLLDLWTAARGIPLREAMDEACEFLGVDRPSFEGYKKREYQKPERPKNLRSIVKAASVVQWLRDERNLGRSIEAYKVAAQGDAIVFPYIRGDEVIHYKFRDVREKKFWASKDTEPCLFGWQIIDDSDRSVILTEGELDAMSWYEYGYKAMSIPFGGGGKKKQQWIEHEYEGLEHFDTIYLNMDLDDTGQQAATEIIQRLGRHRVRVITLPRELKDANECLLAGVSQAEMVDAVSGAATMDPRELRSASAYIEEVIRQFYPPDNVPPGFELPWFQVHGKFRVRPGEVTLLSGFTGHGKSEACGHITAEIISNQGRVCIASLEFKPRKWLARLTRQLTAKMMPGIEHIRQVGNWWRDKLWVFDVVGVAKVDRLLEVFDYAHKRYGIDLFVLDNLSKCGIPEDDYNGQKAAMERITEFAIDTDSHVIIVAHNRKQQSDHEEGNKHDVKGTGALTDLADNVIIWFRNRKKELSLSDHHTGKAKLDDESLRKMLARYDAGFLCEKQRNGDDEPRIGLYFDRESHQFIEEQGSTPTVYVKQEVAK